MINFLFCVIGVQTVLSIFLLINLLKMWHRANKAEAEIEKAVATIKAELFVSKLKSMWAAKRPETLADTAPENDLVGYETTVTNTRPEGGAA